jgi:hypothetical protein
MCRQSLCHFHADAISVIATRVRSRCWRHARLRGWEELK